LRISEMFGNATTFPVRGVSSADLISANYDWQANRRY